MAKKYRADQVGSFLRPPAIKDAFTAHREGKISEEELHKIQDEQILQLLEMEKQSGIQVYSDGEWRRGGWASPFADAMAEGYVPGTPAIRLQGQANPIASRLGASAAETAQNQGGGPGGFAGIAERSDSRGARRRLLYQHQSRRGHSETKHQKRGGPG